MIVNLWQADKTAGWEQPVTVSTPPTAVQASKSGSTELPRNSFLFPRRSLFEDSLPNLLMDAKPLPQCPGPPGPCPLLLILFPNLESEGVSIVLLSHPSRCPGLLSGSLSFPPTFFHSQASLEGNEVGTGGLSGSGLSRES